MSKINFTTVVIPESVKEQLKKEVLEAFPGVTVTVNNLNIWVSGDTKPIKDELKAFGFKWAAKRKAWFMRVPDTAKPYDGYQEQPEEQPEESEQMKAIRAMLEQYKAGNISFDEYMERQKAICAECSARCAVKVAGDVAPAEPGFVRTWYVREYEGDPLGREIPSMLTFAEVYENPQEIYNLTGVADSVIRERIFRKLAHLYGVEYDEIYNRWLGEPASVCSIAERPQKQIAGYLPAPKEEAEPEPELPGMPETEDERLQRVYTECINIMHDAGLETCGQIVSVKINRRLSSAWGRCKTHLKSLNHEIEVRKTLFECDSDTPLKSTILHELCHTVNLCWHGHDANFRNAARKIEAITGLNIARATCTYAELEAPHA